MPDTPTTARPPGAPRRMTARKRWSMWVDQPVKVRAAARAKAEGRDLAEVVREGMARYADGGAP